MLEHVFSVHFPVNCFSINKPQNRYSSTCSIFTLSIFRVSICIFFFADGNFMYLDFATFSDTLLILTIHFS